MAVMLSVTINAPTKALDRRDQERETLRYMLDQLEQQLGNGTSLSGSLLDRSGTGTGTWTYTPVAGS